MWFDSWRVTFLPVILGRARRGAEKKVHPRPLERVRLGRLDLVMTGLAQRAGELLGLRVIARLPVDAQAIGLNAQLKDAKTQIKLKAA